MDVFDFHKMSEVFDRHIFQCQCLGQDCPGSGTVFPNQKTFGCQVFQAVNRVFKRMVSRGNSNVFFCFVDTCFVMIPAKISFLYKAAVEQELKKGTLVQIPLSDFMVMHDFTFLWNKDSVFSQEYESIFHDLCEN